MRHREVFELVDAAKIARREAVDNGGGDESEDGPPKCSSVGVAADANGRFHWHPTIAVFGMT
jgi:hypothetical protein